MIFNDNVLHVLDDAETYRNTPSAVCSAFGLLVDEIKRLQVENEQLQVENEQLRAYKADIENATTGAMDESCDANERHCTCVPLLRAEINRLQEQHTIASQTVESLENHITRKCGNCSFYKPDDGLRSSGWCLHEPKRIKTTEESTCSLFEPKS